MTSPRHYDKPKVICLIRETKLRLSPIRWFGVVENAVGSAIKVVKESSIKRTVRTALAPWGDVCIQDRHYVVKKQLLSSFRPSRGKRVWKHSLSLLKKNFPITEPLLYLELKNGPFTKRTFLVTKWAESTNLANAAMDKHSTCDDLLAQLLKEAARLVASLHNAGFVHGDLKWSNFLWRPSKTNRIVLTDLDHIQRSGSGKKQGRDLARFILSALEFQMGEELADSLANHYFMRRRIFPPGLEKSLEKHISSKQKQYENRSSELSAIRNTNDS